MHTSQAVKQFYERNTRRFLSWGGGRDTGVIHREVWGEGVKTTDEAFHYCHRLVLERMPKVDGRLRILDLGCGVGSSLFYLCERATGRVDGIGVTISPAQVEEAKKRAEARDLTDRCVFIEADFTDLPPIEPVDVIYSIEAFVHAPDAQAYLHQASQVLVPGGRLYLIDDFLEVKESNIYLNRFRRGWQLGSLVNVDQLQKMAAQAGFSFIENLDLTDKLNLGRPRDWFIKAMLKIPGINKIGSAYLNSLVGGDALQTCLKKGWVAYRFIGLERI